MFCSKIKGLRLWRVSTKKIGIVGLGNIFQKAYAPVLAEHHDQAEFVLISANEDKRHDLAKKYNFAETDVNSDEAAELKLDAVMIHSRTDVHYPQVKYFLENGVNVYVDKPLSTKIKEVEELINLAKEKDLILTVGFNRRFAPLVQEVKKMPDKNEIRVLKYRPNERGSLEFQAYDLLIHSLDTALFLIDDAPSDFQFEFTGSIGKIKSATVIFKTQTASVWAGINLNAGADLEKITVINNQQIADVTDLNQMRVRQGTTYIETDPDKWQQMLTTRGFAPLIELFIGAVNGNNDNPVSLDSVLLTHQVIAEMLETVNE